MLAFKIKRRIKFSLTIIYNIDTCCIKHEIYLKSIIKHFLIYTAKTETDINKSYTLYFYAQETNSQ